MNSLHTSQTRRRQRGTTLLEALIAFLVLALGMLTVARVQTQMRQSADGARERSEAVRLAQEELESLRAFAAMAAYDSLANASRNVDAGSGYATATRYAIARRIDPAPALQALHASVDVGWTDRGGAAQQITLHSIVTGSDPALGAALALSRSGMPAKGALARSVRIPLGAKNLGNGSSAFKPVGNGSVAYVFDNLSGLPTGRCSGIGSGIATRDLTNADLTACAAITGQWLSGVVRFSSASPPDATSGNDTPLATAITLTLVGGTAECGTEALKTVSYTANGSLHLEAVPIGATAGSLGLATWTETGDRHLAYHCAVTAPAGAAWSGRTTLLPGGWRIGTQIGDRRVCRYSSDLDASGAIDANIEHPASYANVDSALAHQNFLVINGNESCPGARTAPHQP